MSYIYAYRLTSDSGSAPCIYDLNGNTTGVLTLVCCKGGQIRSMGKKNEKEIKTGMRHTIGESHKEEIANGRLNVYVMGIYKNKLLYFANITKILLMEDYYAQDSYYKMRYDYIYEFSSGIPKRNNNNRKFHPKGETAQHRRDWLGKYALISYRFAYWGKESKTISEDLINILPKYQENKKYKGDSHHGLLIMNEVSALWDFNSIIQNEPHNYLRNQSHKECGKSENNLIS
ncbi:MAG: hypothetical protein FWD79_09570 [Desulfobulbus sp.]|nr:hypothetical protein [Desulfobulbus sp.]